MEPEYRLEKPDQCMACGYPTSALSYYYNDSPGVPAHRREVWLCLVCSGTSTGTAYHYPDQYAEHRTVLRQVSYVANLVLDALEMLSGDAIRIPLEEAIDKIIEEGHDT